MRYLSYEDLLERCNKYLEEYSCYSEEEKISKMSEISNLLEEITRDKKFRISDANCIKDHSDRCQKLDSAMGTILLYLNLADNWYYNRDSKDILREAADEVIPEVIKKSLAPYLMLLKDFLIS